MSENSDEFLTPEESSIWIEYRPILKILYFNQDKNMNITEIHQRIIGMKDYGALTYYKVRNGLIKLAKFGYVEQSGPDIGRITVQSTLTSKGEELVKDVIIRKKKIKLRAIGRSKAKLAVQQNWELLQDHKKLLVEHITKCFEGRIQQPPSPSYQNYTCIRRFLDDIPHPIFTDGRKTPRRYQLDSLYDIFLLLKGKDDTMMVFEHLSNMRESSWSHEELVGMLEEIENAIPELWNARSYIAEFTEVYNSLMKVGKTTLMNEILMQVITDFLLHPTLKKLGKFSKDNPPGIYQSRANDVLNLCRQLNFHNPLEANWKQLDKLLRLMKSKLGNDYQNIYQQITIVLEEVTAIREDIELLLTNLRHTDNYGMCSICEKWQQ